jgi:AraC family transcriptional regulator, transcriptional activator of pobA
MKNIFPHYHIGHFINQPNNNTPFEILIFEEITEDIEVEDPHKHIFYEILWFDEGVSKQIIDYTEYKIEKNTFFFISPNQLHHFEEYKPLKGGSLLFTEDYFLMNNTDKERLLGFSFLDNSFTKPFLKTDGKTYTEMKKVINLIIEEKRREHPSHNIIQSLLNVLLIKLQREIDKSNTNYSKKYLLQYKKFRTLLEEHYEEGWTADKYAESLFMTQHHLNVIVKEITSRTTSDVIKSRSILEAKRLLTFTDMTISEIATVLSYYDLSYFSKIFKAEVGKTPLAFRQGS